jgi:hypothetical protein
MYRGFVRSPGVRTDLQQRQPMRRRRRLWLTVVHRRYLQRPELRPELQ